MGDLYLTFAEPPAAAHALEMTMNVYGHVRLDAQREALEHLRDLFDD
jgi:hypothetical protein